MQKSSSIFRMNVIPVIPLQVGYGWPLGARRAQSFPFEAVPLGLQPFMASSPICILFWGIQLHFGDCQNPSKILMNRVAFQQISLHSPVLHEPCRSPDSVRSPMPTCIPSLSCFFFFGEMKQSRSFRHAQKEFLKRIITLLSLLSTKVK